MQYAEILFQQSLGPTQETLTYSIPSELNPKPGQIVQVSIRGKSKNGIIWRLHNNKPDFKTVSIKKIVQQRPLLSQEQLELAKYISQYYFTPLFKVIKLFIPKRVFEQKPIRSKEKAPKDIQKAPTKQLSPEQKSAVEKINNSSQNSFLIHGITGSGKTEVYTRLAQEQLKKNKQTLILVPEISLTPQTIEYFEKTLGIPATSIHSKLSEGERYRAWESIWKNESKLIIGSRSAIFAPFQDLGIIIIDEEHEYSYKQDQAPRYTVHNIAKKIQELTPETKLIFSSATPSAESKELHKNNTIHLHERIGNSQLPEIEIVDLRDEFQKKNYSIFSDSLQESITQALERKEQIILFLNRRGSASSVVCRDCGHTENCKSCEIPLTYHARTLQNASLICHHCGNISQPPEVCPNCQGPNIRFLGIGTQRIESEVAKAFPQAKTLRADKDSTSTKHGFEKIYRDFRDHKADILIGTQMIAKGIHLPKVSVVGVVLADIGLNIPDFRSSERNFQLMTQVAGRAGRGNTPGKVIIQSYNPESISLKYTQQGYYEEFFQYEIQQRKLLKNPPFSQLAKLTIQAPTLKKAQNKAEELENKLWHLARLQNKAEDLEISSYPAYLTRLRGQYQYLTLIKDISKSGLIHELLQNISEDAIMSEVKIDIDPISTT